VGKPEEQAITPLTVKPSRFFEWDLSVQETFPVICLPEDDAVLIPEVNECRSNFPFFTSSERILKDFSDRSTQIVVEYNPAAILNDEGGRYRMSVGRGNFQLRFGFWFRLREYDGPALSSIMAINSGS